MTAVLRVAFASALALSFVVSLLAQSPSKPYKSPYSVKFTLSQQELLGDIDKGPRGHVQEESSVVYLDWYSPRVREKYGAWGPPARHFPAPAGLAQRSLTWKRERVIATALRFQGYGYQHHHVPDWNPPADWPWKKTGVGHNGKGVDCSNLTAFVYNLALGIKPNGDVKKQAEQMQMPGPGDGRVTHVQRIEKPENYDDLVKTLQTGDLLFIRNRSGELSHVVLWVGSIGQALDQKSLIIDSHGDDVKDSNGVPIPCGVHLRPFTQRSWYYHSASHALRIVR